MKAKVLGGDEERGGVLFMVLDTDSWKFGGQWGRRVRVICT